VKALSNSGLVFLAADLHVSHHHIRYQTFLNGAKRFARIHTLFFPQLLLLRNYCFGNAYLQPSHCHALASLSYADFISLVNPTEASRILYIYKRFGSILYAPDLLTKLDYQEAQEFAYQSTLSYLASSSTDGIALGCVARRDLSLICQTNISPHLLCEPAESVYRATVFLSKLAVIISKRFAPTLSSRCLKKVFLIPDRYSVYLGAAYWAQSNGFCSGVVHADHVFENHLKVADLEVSGAQKIALYNLQQVAGEFAKPDIMFDYAKAYVTKKLIKRSSTQAFSPSNIDTDSFSSIRKYSAQYNKTICYFTSSPDEQIHDDFLYPSDLLLNNKISQGSDLYSLETDFLSDVLEFAIAHDFGVIIRIHPRMNPQGKSTLPSGLSDIQKVLSRFPSNRFLAVDPQVSISSYALASVASLNLFFWSTIGIELSILGFYALSPNSRNSFTYFGYPFMHGQSLSSASQFFLYLERSLNDLSGLPDRTYWAVRGFFIEHAASHFLLRHRFTHPRFSISFRLRRGFFPWLQLSSFTNFTSSLRLPVGGSVFKQIVLSASSIQYPKYMGYWKNEDWQPHLVEYRKWLDDYALPALIGNK